MHLRLVLSLFLLSLFFWGTSASGATVSAGFEAGVLAEYNNSAHGPVNARTFTALGISQAIISQDSDDGSFGGSQGNDYAVTATFLFTDGTSKSFSASVN